MGVQSTAEQLLQTTTVWLWLKTVVLQAQQLGVRPRRSALLCNSVIMEHCLRLTTKSAEESQCGEVRL